MEEPEVQFFGICVPPNEEVEVEDSFDSDQGILATVHATQISLGEEPKVGRHTIFAHTDEGNKFPLGTLERQRCEQFQVDYMLPAGLKLSQSGQSPIYLTGYKTITNLLDPSMEYTSSEEEEDDEDDQDDEQAPSAVPLLKSQLEGAEFSDMDDSEGAEDEEDESDDDDEADEKAAILAAARRGGQVKVAPADEDEDDDEDEDEDEDEEDEEEDDEEPAVPLVTVKAGVKRAALQSQTPKPAKKVKAADQPVAPSTAPAKASTSGGGGDEQYVKALQIFLAKEGPTKLSVLGSQVKKPAGVSKKLKQLITGNVKTFKISDDQVVELL